MRRLWRYEVDEVWGFDDYPEGEPVAVGSVIIDKWKADRTWSVYNFAKKMELVGGWHARLLGEYEGAVDAAGQPVSEPAR